MSGARLELLERMALSLDRERRIQRLSDMVEALLAAGSKDPGKFVNEFMARLSATA